MVVVERLRILILGDGNFSFSLVLCQQLFSAISEQKARNLDAISTAAHRYLGAGAHQQLEILCTSFDNFQELREKYPESEGILQKLAQFPQVQIRHEINAWELKRHFQAEYPQGFDAIIWNHPHLGTENFRLHRFLMAHFFDSAAQVLRKETSGDFVPKICISLVEGQEIRWDLVGQAARSDLTLLDKSPFSELDYPGYICKRNKTGQSFKNSATKKHMRYQMPSNLFRFVKVQGTMPLIEHLPAVQGVPDETSLEKAVERLKITTAIPLESAKVTIYHPNMLKQRRQEKRERVKRPKSTVSLEYPMEFQTDNVLYQCPDCEKKLNTLRAMSQHYHMVHQLNLFPSDPTQLRKCPSTECAHREFKHERDYLQHQISKHSDLSEEEKQWIMGQSNDMMKELCTDDVQQKYVACEVCGQAIFNTNDNSSLGMHLHLESLKPLIGQRMHCPLISQGCQSGHRLFTESRALEQHFRLCRHRLCKETNSLQ